MACGAGEAVAAPAQHQLSAASTRTRVAKQGADQGPEVVGVHVAAAAGVPQDLVEPGGVLHAGGGPQGTPGGWAAPRVSGQEARQDSRQEHGHAHAGQPFTIQQTTRGATSRTSYGKVLPNRPAEVRKTTPLATSPAAIKSSRPQERMKNHLRLLMVRPLHGGRGRAQGVRAGAALDAGAQLLQASAPNTQRPLTCRR